MNEEVGSRRVTELWDRLDLMEREMRFDGRPYPKGMCKFPFKLSGQGFFPGGDGLWREDSALCAVRNGFLPTGGVVFVGNDFGTITSYKKLSRATFENVPTWRHIKARVRDAGIPGDKAFFTNAVMGLREEGTALDKKCWRTIPSFSQFCGDFLRFQLELLAPRLVVVMGPARESFDALAGASPGRVLYTTHPYADFGLSRERLKEEIATLAEAWKHS